MLATAPDGASLTTNDIHWVKKKATFDTVASHKVRLDGKSVGVIVDLFFVGQMDVIVRAVIARVIVVMNRGVSMIVPMFVLMTMLMPVGVRVLMGVSLVSVFVFVRMAVGVLVCMQMLMLMVALHCELLSFGVSV